MAELHAGNGAPWLPPGPLQTECDTPTCLFHEPPIPGVALGAAGLEEWLAACSHDA